MDQFKVGDRVLHWGMEATVRDTYPDGACRIEYDTGVWKYAPAMALVPIPEVPVSPIPRESPSSLVREEKKAEGRQLAASVVRKGSLR